MNKRTKFLPCLGLLFMILVAFSASQAPSPTPINPPKSTSPPERPTPTSIVRKPVKKRIAPTDQPEIIQQEAPIPAPTAESELVNFSAPPLEQISFWRPPLYPIPLALTPFDHFYFSRPYALDYITWPVEDYRYGGAFFEDVVHSGMDIKMEVGTPILATAPGKVVWSGYGLFKGRHDPDDPYGNAVMIRHNFGFQGLPLYTVYAHLDRVDVVADQHVQSGDILGLSGTTGKTSGPHLHFEVRLKQGDFFSTLNPELWLVPPQGWGVLAGRVMNTGGRKVKGQMVIVHSTVEERFWRAKTYHGGNSNSDPYYQENLVVSDLPAGRYKLEINYLSRIYTREIDIYPGLVSYFTFRGRSGFTNEAPPLPGGDFEPPQTP
jgi:murein DD-endopeptidase MepM/ murein hydrolase activator NlpD